MSLSRRIKVQNDKEKEKEPSNSLIIQRSLKDEVSIDATISEKGTLKYDKEQMDLMWIDVMMPNSFFQHHLIRRSFKKMHINM